MLDYLAIIVCRFLRFALRLLGRNGGSKPGEIALKISPNILKRLRYPAIYIAVTGTNGKTSVTGMIRRTFEKAGYKVVSNVYGDNLIWGVAGAILPHVGFDKKIRCDALVLEFDEITFGRKFEHFKPTDVVITNFFRDQLDRCGEMANIVRLIQDALNGNAFHGRIFVNADDPTLAAFEGVTYGLDENEFSVRSSGNVEAAEGRFCPECRSRLHYRYYQYSHIGDYSCPNCDFRRRQPRYSGVLSDRDLVVNGESFGNRNGGLYHYYNELAVIAVAKSYGIRGELITEALDSYRRGIGRMEQIGNVLLNLVKNPTGLNQVLAHLKRIGAGMNADGNENLGESGSAESNSGSISSRGVDGKTDRKSLLFVLNDRDVDGTDVSWIWDADLDGLPVKKIICSGTRAYDIALRFQYESAGFEIEVVEHMEDAVRKLSREGGGYALTTYSALTGVRRAILKAAAEESEICIE